MDISRSLSSLLDWLGTSGVKIAFIVVVMLGLVKVFSLLIHHSFRITNRNKSAWDERKRTQTLTTLTQYIAGIVIVSVAVVLILRELGIQLGPIFAAAGVAGLVLGFGAQAMIKDMINGFFIMMDDEVRVGDIVEAAGKTGTVQKISLRMTVLRDLKGNVHYIPNGDIGVVTNMTKEYSYSLFDINVAYRENVDEVIAVIKEVDQDLRANPVYAEMMYAEPIEVLGLEHFGESAMVIRARIKTRPIKQWKVRREFNRLLKKKFDERGIQIPVPHLTIFTGQDKAGQPIPLALSASAGVPRGESVPLSEQSREVDPPVSIL